MLGNSHHTYDFSKPISHVFFAKHKIHRLIERGVDIS